ncbi:polymorphic toxin-type HINT domain-containing protein [Psychrobacter alimentarius]|uniref:polymorphic toxin-type HINT domain-containing protein n=1 Tax=Psychrobacter alimentarius TaxID=261164 RepID=UPI001D107FBB|nr:polymorphic toxin-type HINT domain-containing protein [Psychrobacter alimentarius]
MLNFTTGSLTTKDLINTATEEQRSIGGSLSVGSTPTGKSLNNVGIQLGHTGGDFESVTHATIGQGAIVTGDAVTGKDSLAGVNRDALNTETIIKDVQTGGLAVDTGIDTRVLTNAGRTEIIDEQKELGKNLKATAAITGTAGLAVPAITAGIFDKGNSNPDSKNKSGINKAKDNFKQLTNNLETGMSDNTVNLNATVEAIVEGELTNVVDNKDTLNQFNAAITIGTDAEGTQISLVDDLRNVNGDNVLGTTNVMNGTDTYLNTESMDKVVELINHEAAHQNGQGEAAAHVMGETGNSAYNLGTWANSGAIAEERTTITPKPITTTNDAKAQQEQLTSDKEKLEIQQDSGDAFEDGRFGGGGAGGSWGPDKNEKKETIEDDDNFIRSVIIAAQQVDAKQTAQTCSGGVCFTAGTLIHTIHGLKPIETINRGELVWSREEFGDNYDYRPVIATKVTPNAAIFEVKIKHDNGLEETINTTEEHPFWIDGEGWRKASILEAGMKLLDKHGRSTATVVSQTALDKKDTVYNFEVQDFSTYHIGEIGIWVHNADCCKIGTINPKSGHKILGEHRVEVGTTGGYIIEGTKPSTKGQLVKTKTQYYENPGHHDPKGGSNVSYNNTKSVLPNNHLDLWNESIQVASDPKNRWAIERKNGKTTYHRFQDDGNGNFHWNGSTSGQTTSGASRAIKIKDIPTEIQR